MNRSIRMNVFALAALALVAGGAHASGSDGASGAETGDAAAYNTGKGVFASRLACSGCKMAGKKLDATEARVLLAERGKLGLNAEESQALTVYLQRRFNL